MESTIDSRLDALAKHPFRAKFHLHHADQEIIQQKGMRTIEMHAQNLLRQRLAPAFPPHDGKQTPYNGHPVFVAQHATATCCRSCLERWHRVSKGHQLSDSELAYTVQVVTRWIGREMTTF